MRITMQSIHRNILGNLNKINEDMNRINRQISSGKQFSKISQDPVNLITALGMRTNLTQITQYQTNLKFGDKTIIAAENSLTQMKDLAARAKVLTLQAANGTLTPENRKNMAKEVQNLFESAITLANTSVNGKYIFGGYRTTGYSEAEPMPFIQDARDGYFINGSRLPDSNSTRLSGTIPDGAAADITTGELLINGVDVVNVFGADVDLTNAGSNGLNMDGAANFAAAINDQKVISRTGAADSLSSPFAGKPVSGIDDATRIGFYINDQFVDTAVTAPLLANDTAAQVATKIVASINAASAGVTAEVGTGANGGQLNAIILRNTDPGNSSPINIRGLNNAEKAVSGLSEIKATEGPGAQLTTLVSGAAVDAADLTVGDTIGFSVNGMFVSHTVQAGDVNNDAAFAASLAAAANAVADKTGVTASIGTGSNGGAANALVFTNSLPGDESGITIANLTGTFTGAAVIADMGFNAIAGNTYTADATHNSGQIAWSSPVAFEISTSAPDDTILNRLGLGGGNLGFADNAGDGKLLYGSRLDSGDLKINDTNIVTTADGISSVYQDSSAAAKAAAVNAATSTTGVSAKVVPASLTAAGAVQAGTEATRLSGAVSNTTVAAADFKVNGVILQNDIAAGAVTAGLNTEKALNAKTEINAISAATGVTASLTTLTAGVAADPSAATTAISFTLNGVAVALNATGTTADDIARKVVDAVNTQKVLTGVSAVIGNGNNGGAVGSVVLRNTLAGDETPIVLDGLDVGETARIGLVDGSQAADATHNTGEITFAADAPFTLSSPNNLNDDTILKEFSLDGGETGGTGIKGDIAGDGIIEYGSTPISLGPEDLRINGVEILDVATAVVSGDSNNALVNAINAKTAETGVKASRNSGGQLILSALDGRNIQIQTSAMGEKVTRLTGQTGPQDRVYFGEIKLEGGREFFIDSATTTVGAVTSYETGFAALGLAGGEAVTGISGDTAADGKLFINKIHYENGAVRYAGDRDNDFAIKVGPKSEMKVAENGEASIMDTGIFTILNNLKNYLEGGSYKTLNGVAQATDTKALLGSGKTGLPLASELKNGSFAVSVTRHDQNPPTTSSIAIGIDLERDSLEDIANRINGVPGLSASWSGEGYLQINSTDPDRYTFDLTGDTSNFLRVVGAEAESLQTSNLGAAVADLDLLMNKLTDQISDFGSRSNRIIVQQQIYSNLELATSENLSEREDTDMFKAVMELQAKEVAYQAALSAAAKTMQMSLVDFLK